MSYPARQFHRPHAPTKAQHRAALQTMLCLRETLDGLNVERLARSHGLTVNEISAAVAAETARRAQ